MARYRGPKNRIARRFGANIFDRARNPLLHKPNPPGVHGARRRKKSDYGMQLEEKQKLKACYGMLTEKQVVIAFKKCEREEGNTAALFMERLECRLDNIVFRLGFGRTIFAARQLVAHGHIFINGKKVDRPSFFVRPDMEISIHPDSRGIKAVVESLELRAKKVPSHCSLDKDNFKGKLVMSPELSQIEANLPLPINIAVVCEFLAHHN